MNDFGDDVGAVALVVVDSGGAGQDFVDSGSDFGDLGQDVCVFYEIHYKYVKGHIPRIRLYYLQGCVVQAPSTHSKQVLATRGTRSGGLVPRLSARTSAPEFSIYGTCS